MLQMARIKIKYGQNEIEIESKDFYIDNESVEQVICNLASFVKDSSNNSIQYEYSYENQVRRQLDCCTHLKTLRCMSLNL